MIEYILGQTTQPVDINLKMGAIAATLTLAITLFSAVIVYAIKKYFEIKATIDEQRKTTQNVAAAVKDVATDGNSVKLSNVSPETIPTLNNVIAGGTGDGTVANASPLQP